MTLLWILLVLVLAFALSYAGTGVFRHLAVRRSMVDIPGARSSHAVPTPRGGGAAFSLLLLLALAGSLLGDATRSELWIALLGGGSLVAVVGWLDDRFDLQSYVRLGLYAVSAAWAAAWIKGLPVLPLGFASLRLGWFGYLFSWGSILAFTNIYNFMDGIDGLAGAEGASVSLAAGVVFLVAGELQAGWLLIGLAVLLVGFLCWNWHPAKIFMGDVGSNLLGFVFATMAFASDRLAGVSIWVWAVLLGVFVVDGFATLGRRLLRGLPPHQAHRCHAYQGAVQRGHSHAQVTLAVVGINILLTALAVAAWLQTRFAIGIVVVSYVVLFVVHLRYSPLTQETRGR